MLRRRSRLAAVTLTLVWAFVMRPASAATTKCSFGGPAPGFKAVRLDLPSGSSFLNIEILGTHDIHGLNTGDGDGWHLAQGVVLIRSSDGAIVASRLSSAGSSPPGAIVRAGGVDSGKIPVPAADVALSHSFGPAVPFLDPGSYYAIAWGAGGRGPGGPPDAWSASVEVEGAHNCAALGAGEVFDLDQNDFTGGTQVTAPGIGHMDGAWVEMPSSRSLVVGMIDAAVQGAGSGEARVDYLTPSGASGTADREVEAFTGGAGTYLFTAHVTGLLPVVAVNGVRIDLP
jgi:hypothetical protein